jgi:uncharacterized protein (TIGR02271 family)
MQTVIGAFEDPQLAQRALERLVQAGFDRDDVHVQEGAAGGTTGAMGADTRGADRPRDEDHGIMESIGDFFASLFGEDKPTGRSGVYAEAVRRGTSVVVVDADDDDKADMAARLLHELGAIDVDERAQQWRASGWTGYGQEQPQVQTGGKEGVLDVVQEELQVGKRDVDRGGVRVFQRVSQKPVRELVRLREERAVVERRPVNREATAEDLSNFREGSIEVRETAEEPVVSKRARVVEEVRVGKEVEEREQAVEDTVRRKDVDVERIEGQGERMGERERAVAADDDRTAGSQSRDPDASRESGQRKKAPAQKPTSGKS